VPYRIYRDANRSNLIAIDGTIAGTGTGALQQTPIYGRVEPPTPPPVGSYQDFIVVTLSF
jgi:spore coat protein U-like protein